IGAGPVGLAAAAHLVLKGETPLILEAGPEVGASVRKWGHVRIFSPWQHDVDTASAALLAASGWKRPPDAELPPGHELLDPYPRAPADPPHILPAAPTGPPPCAWNRAVWSPTSWPAP